MFKIYLYNEEIATTNSIKDARALIKALETINIYTRSCTVNPDGSRSFYTK